MADVAETEDADHPLALVDHRQPAELQLLHVMHRLCKVIVLPAAMDAFGHYVARRRAACIEVVAREPFADDVAVGHHSDQSVVLSSRNAADVMRPHQFRKFGGRGGGADPVDTLVHHFFDFHGGTSVTGFQVRSMQCSTAPPDFSTIQPIGREVADKSIIPARSGHEPLLPWCRLASLVCFPPFVQVAWQMWAPIHDTV